MIETRLQSLGQVDPSRSNPDQREVVGVGALLQDSVGQFVDGQAILPNQLRSQVIVDDGSCDPAIDRTADAPRYRHYEVCLQVANLYRAKALAQYRCRPAPDP